MGQLAAAFIAVSSVVAFFGARSQEPPIVAVLGVGLAAALAFWFAPWDRWPRNALLAIVIVSFALKSAGNVVYERSSYLYAIHYVVTFMWIGIALPRWSSAMLTPLFAISYLAPLWFLDAPPGAIASIAIVLPG